MLSEVVSRHIAKPQTISYNKYMKKVTLWNLRQNQAVELQGQPIAVTTANPEFTAEQMMRNRCTQEYEARVEDAEPEHDLDI